MARPHREFVAEEVELPEVAEVANRLGQVREPVRGEAEAGQAPEAPVADLGREAAQLVAHER